MSKALESILGYMPLTEALRATSSGVPNPFPQEFFNVKPSNRVLGDKAKYIRITGERRTAAMAKYGSPARRHTLRDISSQNVGLLHSNESFTVDFMMLQKLMSFEKYVQDEGMDWLQYQFAELGKRHGNSRIISVASMLRYGAIYWDAAGNILPSSSGSTESATFNVPATHQDQINGIIAASWVLSNTDIPAHIRALKDYAAKETGLPIATCLYGKNVASYMMNNDFVSAYLSRNPNFNNRFVESNEIPDGLFDIKWIPVHTAFFEDYAGTNQSIWGDDLAVFTPAINQPDKMDWYAMYEGSYPVPRSLDVQRDPMGVISNNEIVHGQFAYGVPGVNPPGAEVYHGDTWLPGLRNEKAIFQCDVAF